MPGEVNVYPGPLHYAGDILSIEIVVHNPDRLPTDREPRLILDGDRLLEADPFYVGSPLRDPVLVFRWVWNTSGQAGLHQLTAEVPTSSGDSQTLTFHVEILRASDRPEHEARAEWQERTTACCRIAYLSGTAAARDIDLITQRVEDAVAAVEGRLGVRLNQPFPIILIDNVWGNGAYADDEIVISYVDRAYVSLDLDSVIRHEAVHYAARAIGGEAPTLLVEGVAVYLAGGHYKPEPIPERAAALLALEAYIPLADLADHFRDRQHEIAYLEAAGLIAYLVETYGWQEFLNLYALTGPDGSPSQWLDQAFKQVYGVGLAEIEQGYLAWLGQRDPGDQADDLRLTVALFETIRRYQALYAPYQEALPSLQEARARGITAEFLREPASPENVALETALIAARLALEEGRFAASEGLIDAVNTTLDDGDFTRHPIGDYLAVASTLASSGYEAQQIDLLGSQAVVLAIREWPNLETVTLARTANSWEILTAR